MAMADTSVSNYPLHAQSVRCLTATTTAANADLAAADNAVELTDPSGAAIGAKGGVLTGLSGVPRATCVQTFGYLFLSQDDGVTKLLIGSVEIAAATVDATNRATPVSFTYTSSTPLELAPGSRLYIAGSQALAAGYVWLARVLEFT